jgi:hypothetical protein
MQPPDVKPGFHAEGAGHILPSGIPVESSLRNGLSITIKAIQNAQFTRLTQPSCQFASLIKSAFAATAMVERHRHEGMPLFRRGMRIEGFGQPFHQARILVILILVLEAKNRFAHLAVGAVSGTRPLKVPLVFRAIGANESRVDGIKRWKGIAALPAIRRLDPHRSGLGTFRPGEREVQRALGPVAGAGVGCTEG